MRSKKKKKDEILPFVTTWMGPVGIMLREIRNKNERRPIPYDVTHTWNLKKKKE